MNNKRNSLKFEDILLTAVDWNKISERKDLSNEFIRKYSKYIKWNILLKNRKLDKNLIEQCFQDINVADLIIYQSLSEDLIEKVINKTNSLWGEISHFQNLSENFIDKYKDKLVWAYLLQKGNLSEKFLISHDNYIDWCALSRAYKDKLSDDFLFKYREKVDWDEFSARNKPFSNRMLKRLKKYINWNIYVKTHKLTEKIIERNLNYFDKKRLLTYQYLSEDFIELYADKLGWNNISELAHLSMSFLQRYRYYVNWGLCETNRNIITSNRFSLKEFNKIRPNPIVYHIKNFIRKHA